MVINQQNCNAGNVSMSTGSNGCGTHEYIIDSTAINNPPGIFRYMVCRRCGHMLALTRNGAVDLGMPTPLPPGQE